MHNNNNNNNSSSNNNSNNNSSSSNNNSNNNSSKGANLQCYYTVASQLVSYKDPKNNNLLGIVSICRYVAHVSRYVPLATKR